MPCNCGSKVQKQEFVYTSPKGVTKVYTTEIEARAAAVRAGGGSVTPRQLRG